MIIPIFAASLYCPAPKLRDTTHQKWTQTDEKTLLYAMKEGCRKHDLNQPCLYIFQKSGEGEYTAICGPMKRHKYEK